MTNRTMQEEFDIVVEHLVTQGVQCVDGDGNCVYRGPNGLKCAIGALIPDEQYQEEMDTGGGSVVTTLVFEDSLLYVEALSASHALFYGKLQGLHDDNASWGEKGFIRMGELMRIANEFQLDNSIVTKYYF